MAVAVGSGRLRTENGFKAETRAVMKRASAAGGALHYCRVSAFSYDWS